MAILKGSRVERGVVEYIVSKVSKRKREGGREARERGGGKEMSRERVKKEGGKKGDL